MTTIFIRQFLRITPILYRSRVVASSFRRNHEFVSNVPESNLRKIEQPVADNEKATVKVIDFILQLESLKEDVEVKKRVSYKYFCDVVNTAVENYVAPSESVLFLDCCTFLPSNSKQEITQLIDTIWNDGVIKYGQPTKEQILALLRAYKVIGRSIEDFKAFLAQHDCDEDAQLFEEYLHLICANGETSERIVEVLSEIKNRGFPLTVNVFNSLILGHSKNRNVENCEKVFDTMISMNLKPGPETYMQLVRVYIENGDMKKAVNLWREHCKTFSREEIFSIIKAAAEFDSADLLKEAINWLPDDSLMNKNVVPELRYICTELIRTERYDKAYKIIENLPIIKYYESEDTDTFGTFFIYEMIRQKVEFVKILDIVQKLIDSDRNKRALHRCCEIMLRTKSPHALDCLKALGQREQLRPHYFWPLFMQHYHADGESGILNVLEEMKSLEVQVDKETLLGYVLMKLPLTMKDPKQGIRILMDKGLPITLLLTPVVIELLRQFKLDEALTIIKLHQTKVVADLLILPSALMFRNFNKTTPVADFAKFAELIHTINARNANSNRYFIGQFLVEIITKNNKTVNASVFVSILEQFNKIGIKISPSTYEELLGHVQQEGLGKKCADLLRKMKPSPTEAAEILKHQRDTSIDELEYQLIELQSKNMNARGVLRRLLQRLVRAGRNDRALEIHKLCKKYEVNISPGMLASILDLMIRTKNVSEAEATLKELQKVYPEFTVDEYKVVDLAALMVENDRIDDARRILEDRAKTKVRGGNDFQKNIWALLTKVSEYSVKIGSSVNQSEKFLEFLIQLGYCDYHNTLLGPIIKEHILKNEIGKAVTEFEKAAAKYKKTPMHFELMTKLIEISNSEDSEISPAEAKEMLAKVLEIVVSIYGTANANVSLVVAIAKAGTENQLRKLLFDPKLELNAELLMKQCEYLSQSGAESTIYRLAKCSRGLYRQSTVLNEEVLYDLLLNEYARENNHEAALALFERLIEDEDIRISITFVRKLADLIERNNMELPSTVRMYLRKS